MPAKEDTPIPGEPPLAAARPAAKAPRARKVRVSTLLTGDTILVAKPGPDKDALLKTLVERLCAKHGLRDPKAFLAKVIEREQGISTTLDTGLSLPHARMDNLADIVAGLAVLPDGMTDPRQSDLTIRIIFLFFSPNKQECFPLHLQVLRGVSALFQPALIDRIVKAASPAAILDLLRQAES